MPVSRAVSRKLFASAALPISGLLLLLTATAPVFASPSVPAELNQTEHARLQVPIFRIASASISHGAAPADSSPTAAGTARNRAPAVRPESEISEQGLNPASLAESLPADGERAIEPPDDAAEQWPVVQTRIPGVSGVELQRFSLQMFRRDI